MKYPAFSSFRELITIWDDYLLREAEEAKLNALLDNFVLFFEKDKNIFGATEESRVIFARLKNPDKELPDGWEDEASFSAQNLTKTVAGEASQHVFQKSDLKNIQIIDREKALQKLKGKGDDFTVQQTTDADPVNFIQASED